MAEAKTKRYRLTVPVEDQDVIEWMAAQVNASWSLRVLIRKQIKMCGMVDVTCGPVRKNTSRVGRPSKDAIAARDRALETQEAAFAPVESYTPAPARAPAAVPAPAPRYRPADPVHPPVRSKAQERPVAQYSGADDDMPSPESLLD